MWFMFSEAEYQTSERTWRNLRRLLRQAESIARYISFLVRGLLLFHSPLFLVEDPHALFDELEGHRHRSAPHLVERAHEVDAFQAASFGVVVMPADELALVGVGLLLYGVVYDQNAIIAFDLAHKRLDQAPQRPGVHLLGGEEAGDPVMADFPLGHPREAGGGGMGE
jgi:hypothetical protein